MSFAFDDNSDLFTNLEAFGDHIEELDPALGIQLRDLVTSFLDGSVENAEVWDRLFAATASTTAGAAVASAVLAGASAAQPAVNTSTTMGWFLEGISIEGFRGINNEGKPLELEFYPNKVNSVSAVNGVGKSSIHDAIRYAISGRVEWLEELPASEKAGDYYLNRFNSSGKAVITLRLVEDPTGNKCEVTVVRDKNGNRTVSASDGWQGEAVLRSLDREFVLLDGPTFQHFIGARPLERGRTFSGLLGLSNYSLIRQALTALSNTKAHANHFKATEHAQTRAREEKNITDFKATIGKDFEVLVGQDLGADDTTEAAQSKAHAALAQIGPLATPCQGKTFQEIDIDECIEAVKTAEGGPKRERLIQCVTQRANLSKLGANAPTAEAAEKLLALSTAREQAVSQTSGDAMLQLYQAGAKVLGLPEWEDPIVCPLCEIGGPHDLRVHLQGKISEFEALDQATKAVAQEWEEGGWSDLPPFEAVLEDEQELRLGSTSQPRGLAGKISSAEAKALITWLETLKVRALQREQELAAEQTELEKELPQSSVEVTKKIEAARRLQLSWTGLGEAEALLADELDWQARVETTKKFLDQAAEDFGTAETALSKARLSAVEPLFKDYFKRMAFAGVVPSVAKRANSEDLQIALADFYGQKNLSPQALLSESFRNAFAVSLYLAAASLYGGVPRFIILDDVTSSFDAGHQNFLVELLRTTFARPSNATGPQVILLSHDTMLEKLFNRHTNTGGWLHQRLEGSPQFAVLPQAGAVNKVRDHTISQLQAGQVDSAKEGVRQYLEYRLSDLISRLRIPVPVDVAFNDNKQLSSEFLSAIEAAVKLHSAAGSLVLEPAQVAGLNVSMASIVGNFLSHWGTGQALSFTGPALVGVMQAIDDYCECFTYEPTPGAARAYYKALNRKI